MNIVAAIALGLAENVYDALDLGWKAPRNVSPTIAGHKMLRFHKNGTLWLDVNIDGEYIWFAPVVSRGGYIRDENGRPGRQDYPLSEPTAIELATATIIRYLGDVSKDTLTVEFWL